MFTNDLIKTSPISHEPAIVEIPVPTHIPPHIPPEAPTEPEDEEPTPPGTRIRKERRAPGGDPFDEVERIFSYIDKNHLFKYSLIMSPELSQIY